MAMRWAPLLSAQLSCLAGCSNSFAVASGLASLDDTELLIHSLSTVRLAGFGSPKHGNDRAREDRLRKEATCEAVLEDVVPIDRELSKAEWHEYGERAMCTRRKILISRFAELIPKVPAAYVRRLKELNHSKVHHFNFQGSMDFQHASRKEQRRWILPFAKEHFSEGDVFRLTDASTLGKAYVPLGAYDVSLAPLAQSTPETTGHSFFDPLYFETMAASNFTLCPSGDAGWSVRVWEAAATGSICVVRSLKLDVNGNDLLCRIPYKFYTVNSSLTYSQDVAEHNFRMFVKYQTFLEGDNIPPPGCNGMIVQ